VEKNQDKSQIKTFGKIGLTIFLPIFFSQPASDWPKLMARMRATKTKIRLKFMVILFDFKDKVK